MLQAYKQSWLHTFHWNRRMDWDTYWQAMVMHILVGFVPSMPLLFMQDDVESWLWHLFMLPFSFSIFPMIGSTVQRLHDVGKSAGFLLVCYLLSLAVIGVVVLIWVIRKESFPYDNKWGAGPESKEKKRIEGNDFVDEEVTEQSIQLERRQLFKVLAMIVGIFLSLFLLSYVLIFVEAIWDRITWEVMMP